MSKENRTVIITGAGQGVGQGIALAFARKGSNVVLTGRTLEKLEATAAAVQEAGGQSLCIECDVKSESSLIETVDKTVERFGGVDVLVNNAQQVPLGKLLKISSEAFSDGIESGPVATFKLMKLVQPHMKQAGGGVIINLVSSAMKRWDMTSYGAYAAVKAAIQSLTRAAAAEWGRDNIRAIAIAPHAESPGLKYWIEKNPEEAEAFFKTIPLGRVGTLEEDIGRAVVALCSDDIAYLTGATIPLDGGQANFN